MEHPASHSFVRLDELPRKKDITVAVEEVSPKETGHFPQHPGQAQTWTPGFRRRFPWLGFSAMLTILWCSVGAILTLHFSNRKSASEWSIFHKVVPPNVVLSILNNIANLSVAVAVAQGVAIAWWRRALDGATVKELHHSWAFSTSISQVLWRCKYFNVIALAACMTKLAIVDGVLYQKATSAYVGTNPNATKGTVSAFASPEFMFTGRLSGDSPLGGQMNYNYSTTYYLWQNFGNSINTQDSASGCDGAVCTYGLEGAGFSFDCTNTTENVNYGKTARSAYAANSTLASKYSNLTMFSVDLDLQWPAPERNYSSILLHYTYASTDYGPVDANGNPISHPGDCPVQLTHTTCELRVAQLNYTVQFFNDNSVAKSEQGSSSANGPNSKTNTPAASSFAYQGSGSMLGANCPTDDSESDVSCGYEYNQVGRQLYGVDVTRPSDLIEHNVDGTDSRLIGVYIALKQFLSSSVKLSYNGHDDWYTVSTGYLANYELEGNLPPVNYCNYSYSDPTYDIISSVNALTYMTVSSSIDSYVTDWTNTQFNYTDASGKLQFYTEPEANYSSVLRTVNATVIYKDVFYSTNYSYMYGALAATVVCVLCILPAYWKFWELGRDVSLGPFEIANAFQGPAFASVGGGAGHAKDVLKYVGRTKVKYGEVEGAGNRAGERRLGFRNV